jgi:hypothetical protein
MSWIRVITLLGIVAVLGCGSKGEKVTPPTVSAKDSVKKALEGLVESGRGGSEIGAIMRDLETLKATDAALAGELITDARGLMSTTLGRDEIKVKAQEMLKKLEGVKGG